ERHAQLHGNGGATSFFETQKHTLKQRVVDAEKKLGAFVDREGLVLPEDQIRTILKDANRGQDSVALQTAKIRGLERRVVTLKEQLTATPPTVKQSTERLNPTGQGLGFELVKKEAERADLLHAYTEDDRRVQDVNAEIATLRARIKDNNASYIIGTERVEIN